MATLIAAFSRIAPIFAAGTGLGHMTSKADIQRTGGQADRKARLADELRANLQRRKAQARSRRAGDADERPEGLNAAGRDRGHSRKRLRAAGKRRQDLTGNAAV